MSDERTVGIALSVVAYGSGATAAEAVRRAVGRLRGPATERVAVLAADPERAGELWSELAVLAGSPRRGPVEAVSASASGVPELVRAAELTAAGAADAVLVVGSGHDAPAGALLLVASGDATGYREFARVEGAAVSAAGAGAAVRSALAVPERPEALVEHLRFAGVLDGLAEQVDDVRTALREYADAGELSCVAGWSARTGLGAVLGLVHDIYTATLPATPDEIAGAVSGGAPVCVSVTRQPWVRRRRDGRRTGMLCVPESAGGAGALVLSNELGSGYDTPIDWIDNGGPALIVLDGDDGPALLAGVAGVRSDLARGLDPFAIARRAAAVTGSGRLRAVLVATDADGLRRELDSAEKHLADAVREERSWATPGGSFCTGRPLGPDGKVAFVYPGTFAMHPGAEAGLFRLFPGLLAGVESFESRPFDALAIADSYLRAPHRPTPDEVAAHATALRSDVGFISSAGVYFGLLSTPMLKDLLGIVPDGGFGYSMGEICMLWGLGVWAQSEEIGLGVRRSPIFTDELFGRRSVVRRAWDLDASVPDDQVWLTVVVVAPVTEVRAVVERYDRVFITHVDMADEVVLAGDPAQCRAVLRELGAPSVPLPGGGPVLHVPLVERAGASVRALTEHDLSGRAELPELFFATRPDVDLRDAAAVAGVVEELCRSEVDFAALCARVHDAGYRYFIEVGPGSDGTRWIGRNLAERPHVAVSIDQRGGALAMSLARALARLISAGLEVDLSRLFGAPESTAEETEAEMTGRQPVGAADGPAAAPAPRGGAGDDDWDVIRIEEPLLWEAGDPPPPEPVRAPEPVAPEPIPDRRPIPAANGHAPAANGRADAAAHLAGLGLRGVATSAAWVAQAHIAALQAQSAFQTLLLTRLEHQAGLDHGEPDAPAAGLRIVGDSTTGDTRTVLAELDSPWDESWVLGGRVVAAAFVRAVDEVLALAAPFGPDRAVRTPRLSWVHRDRTPVAGAPIRLRLDLTRDPADAATLRCIGRFTSATTVLADVTDGVVAATDHRSPAPAPVEPRALSRRALRRKGFKPIEDSGRTGLAAADLERLARGRMVEVFGPRWDQRRPGGNSRIAAAPPGAQLLAEVTEIDSRGGEFRFGSATALLRPDAAERCGWRDHPAASLVEAASQLVRVYAIGLGLPLVFADAELLPARDMAATLRCGPVPDPGAQTLRYELEVVEIAMVPRPAVIANVHVYAGEALVATVETLGIEVREVPGSDYRPELRDGESVFLGRYGTRGEVAWLNEFHLAHMESGDLSVAMGQVVDGYRGKTRLHLPNSEFRLVDRIVDFTLADAKLRGGSLVTEYDAARQCWYFHDNSFDGIPGSIVMESTLQAAAVTGSCMGTMTVMPLDQKLSVRNLDGTATFLADIDVRGRTWRQHTQLLSTTHVVGQVLQRFRYTLEVDGVPYYEGTSLFGYFTDQALASQVGLDGGKEVGCRLDEQAPGPDVEVAELDLTGQREWLPDNGLRLGEGHFGLLDRVWVVRDGGRNGLGYLKGTRRIDPDDWYFDCHFHGDPVMPGSLGVEAAMQGLQTYVIAAGLADDLGEVRFAVPTGIPFTWSYRGQILRHEERMDVELDVTEVRRTETGLVVVADASVFKPGMRIYEFSGLAVEVREVRS
ncbi:hypothetical protein IU433_06470 [Nocardia puris]|uniref:PfaB family protein n=2 Tax=Nocardia puris TaxID=208602 RepID=A0A366DEZ6_9NOCA|nr:hypothetical protein [Nocardia puris]MBF6211178.1 hypothetical protein [Nocardia puris]MBF6364897.1 hypothetical protein [Nocardia puris]MBF6458683.1 hypothetical protein [Nocardia puris]RBO87818.1 PfaB family protein [Nocardia puris]